MGLRARPIFEPALLHDVVRLALGRPLPEMIERIAAELDRRYPGHIAREHEWILNNAGGAMGQMLVLHASLTEYLIVLGSTLDLRTLGRTFRVYGRSVLRELRQGKI